MRRPPAPWLVAAVLLTTACAGVDDVTALRDRADDVGDQVTEVSDQARFCFAVTRALTGLDGGTSPEQAYEAAEEVLARVPDELRDDAELVARTLERAAEDGDHSTLEDEGFQAAAERLHDGTRELCDPR